MADWHSRLSRSRGTIHRRGDPVERMLTTVVGASTAIAVILILQPLRDMRGGGEADAAILRNADLVGTAEVIDGDTLDIGGQRVRLHGIDAFERNQRCGGQACGQEASAALRRLADGRTTACEVRDTDRYGRLVAVCHVAGTDINGWMVENGHAVAYRRYSTDYVSTERQAEADGLGAWAHGFTEPEAYRHR